MFFHIVLAITSGVFCGTFTGLAPGIHTNLVALLLLSASPFLLQFTSPIVLCCFIIAVAVTHTFLDTLPSIFLGAPDEEKVLNVLPGHKLLLQGKGFDAVKLTIVGSFLALVLGVLLAPITVPFSGIFYNLIKDYTGYALLVITAFMILKDKNRLLNLFIFLLSGVLGILVLNMPNLKDPLFPMLSGLFGISGLLMSLFEKVNIPDQSFDETVEIKSTDLVKAVFAGTFAGTLTGFLPGLGPAQGAVLASQVVRKIGDYGFMVLVGGIGTVNFVFSLVTLYTIEKSRSGVVVVMSKMIGEFGPYVLAVFMCVSLIAGGISVLIAMKITRVFAKLISKVNYALVASCVIFIVTSLVFYFSGILGLLVLVVSTAIGIIPCITGTARNHQMGCLLLPVILFFLL